jgi:hypothetical protein
MTSRKLVLLGAGLAAVAAIAGGAILALTVLGDSAEPRPPTTAELVTALLAGPPGPEQAKTARLLAARLDPAAVRRVSASRNPNAVALVRKRLIAISTGATQNPRRRTRAVACLEELDDRASANAVAAALLEDPQPSVRRAAGAALARMESAPLVVKRLVLARDAQRSPAVREVDRVLVAIGGPAVAPMLPLIDSESWTLDVIADIGKPAVPPLRRQLNRGTFTQQVAASYGLLAIRRTEPQAVRSAVRTIVTLMMRRLANMQQAFEASEVLAHVGRPAFDVLLPLARRRSEDLVGIEKKQGPFSAQALAMLAIVNPKAAGPLFAALRNRDYDLIADLHHVYIQLGRPGSEPALIGALDAHGDPIMALAFLYSGNRKLDAGARRWAARNGYTITGESGTSIPGSWGNANTVDLG